MTQIKLIASDLDGTLLNKGRTTIRPEVFDLIRKLREKGVYFVASSGRQLFNIKQLFEPVRDLIGYVAENGSLCEYQHEILYRGEIDQKLGIEIMEAIREREHCECILSCESTCYMENSNPEFVHLIRDVVKNEVTVVDDMTKVSEPFLKIAYLDELGTDHSFDYFREKFEDQIKVVTSGNEWVDFIAPGANKGLTLKRLLDRMQIAPEHTVAFGDQYNDIEMLQLAGTSYAMSTAAPGVNYYSDYVTDSVEEVMEDILSEL